MRMQENGAAAGAVVKRSQEQRARECIIEKERVLKEGTHTPFLPSLQGREYARLCRHYRLSEMDKGTATRRGRHGASVSILVCKQACRRMCVCVWRKAARIQGRARPAADIQGHVWCGKKQITRPPIERRRSSQCSCNDRSAFASSRIKALFCQEARVRQKAEERLVI